MCPVVAALTIAATCAAWCSSGLTPVLACRPTSVASIPPRVRLPGRVFALANVLSAAAATFSGQSLSRALRTMLRLGLRFKRSSRILPVRRACREALGTTVPYLDEFLDHEDPSDIYWRQLRPDLSRWRVPKLLSPQAGPQDNSAIEARADVLVFTGEPLRAPLDVLGPVRSELHVRASSGHAHVFVRLCNVDTEGRSRNVTDGIVRLGPGVTGRQAVSVPMSSTAHHLAPGHRLRLRVSGGAFPRFARNTGTGESLTAATRLVPTDVEVFHDLATQRVRHLRSLITGIPAGTSPPDHLTRRLTLRFLSGQVLISTVGKKRGEKVTPGRDRIRRGGRHPHRARAACAAALAVLTLAVLTLAGCGTAGAGAPVAPSTMTVSSEAFISGMLSQRYTCHGAGINPPLNWSGAPPGTKSLALIVDDSSAPITPYIYWIVFHINPGTTDIQEGSLPTDARQGRNSAGSVGYDAPCPTHQHVYRFTVYALRTTLNLPNGAPLQEVWPAIAAATIGRGRIAVTGTP